MNSLNIICFLSVVRTQNFSITAKELSITQQAVSRNIQSLEQELGFPLFYRDYHSVRLTMAGATYHQVFSEYAQDLATAARICSYDTDTTLRVGCGLWAGLPGELSPLIGEYSARVPLRMVQTDDAKIGAFLQAGEMDVALVPKYLSRSIGEGCNVVPLFELPVYLLIEADHPLISQAAISDILNVMPHFTAAAGEPDADAAMRRVYREYAKLDYFPKTVTVLPNVGSTYTQVLCGGGITFSPKNRMVESEYLYFAPLPRTVTISAVFLNRCKNPYARAFSQFLSERAGGAG